MGTNLWTGDHSVTIQAAAKKAALLNPRKRRRDSGTVKAELDNLRTRLADNLRQLSEMETHREELRLSLMELNTRVATMRREGIPEAKFADLVGYNFYSKSQDRSVHVDGTIEVVAEELRQTDKRIGVFTEGQKNLSALCEKELPRLEAELAATVRLEKLGA